MRFATRPFNSLPYPLRLIVLVLIYFVMGRVGLFFSVMNDHVSMVWPPSGLALAALLLWGYELWPGIALGAFLVNLSNGVPVAGAALIAAGNTLESLAGAYLLLRHFNFQKSLQRIYDVACFVIVAALGVTMIGATIGTLALGLNGGLDWPDFSNVWGVWWAGDLMGVLILTPLLLTWAASPALKWAWPHSAEPLALFSILTLVSLLVFATPLTTVGFYPLAYMTFPFVIWAAFRFGIRGVAVSHILIWVIAAWGTVQHIGPFFQGNVQESLIFICSYVGVISITGLLLAAAIDERKNSEASLKENQALLQAVLEHLPFEVWVRDTDNRCVMQNPVSVALWGDLIGKGLEGLTLDDPTYQEWSDHNQRVLAGATERRQSEVMIRGEKHYFYSVAAPFWVNKTMRGIMGVNVDITEQKQIENALRQSEERFSQAFRANPAALSISTLDEGILVDVNPSFVRFSGFRREEVIGHTAEELNMVVGEFGRKRLAAFLKQHGKTPISEGEVRIRSGDIRRVQYSAELMDIEGQPHVLGIFTDITEQKQAEVSLRASEARFRAIFEGASLGIIVVDEQGYCLSTNPAISRILGYSASEFRNMRFRDFTYPDDIDKNMELFHRLQAGEIDHYEMEKRYIHKEGGVVWARLSVSALIDPATKRLTSVSVIEDITERRRAEQALRASEARLRAIFEGATIGIAVFEPGGTAIAVNPALQRITGYSEAELLGIRFRQFTYPDDIQPTVDLFQQLQRGEINHYQIAKRYIHKNGSVVWTQLSVAPIGPSNGQGVMAVALIDDISERRMADEALRESEARFRAIFEGANIGMAVVDEQGYLTSANPTFFHMLGYQPIEIIGKAFREFTYAEDVHQNLELFNQLMTGQVDHYQYEKRYVRKDGGLVWVRTNVSTFPNRDQRLALALVEDITQAKEAEAALRDSEIHNKALLDAMPDLMFLLDKEGVFLDYRAPEGAGLFVPPSVFIGKRIDDVLPEVLTVPMHALIDRAFASGEMQFFEYDTPYGDDPNTYESRILAFGQDKILIISRDITERKRAEAAIQQLNADLERRVEERTAELAAANERLTELDRLKSKFIADVSHELRTPLAVLNTRVYLLENGVPEKRIEYLTGLRTQIERLTQFVNTVLDLSRLELGKGKVAFEAVNLNEVVDQVTVALEPRAEASGLRLNLHADERLPAIQGEFNQLAQVATNLIANAINYTPNGHIDVSTGLEDGQVYLRVEDTGMGIAPDDIPHLFERFYRGERAGQTPIAGSGLGLSIVKEIVDLHNGAIHVESEPGKGTVFTVTLPI